MWNIGQPASRFVAKNVESSSNTLAEDTSRINTLTPRATHPDLALHAKNFSFALVSMRGKLRMAASPSTILVWGPLVWGSVVWIPGINKNEKGCYLRVSLVSPPGPQTTNLPLALITSLAQKNTLWLGTRSDEIWWNMASHVLGVKASAK